MADEQSELIEKYDKITLEDLKKYKEHILKYNIPLMRLNKEKNLVIFPTEQIDIILENERYSSIILYAPKNLYKSEEFVLNKNAMPVQNKSFATPEQAEKEMKEALIELSKTSYEKKVSLIKKHTKDILEIAKKPEINKEAAQQIVDVGHYATLINKLNMFDSMQKIKKQEITSEEAKEQNKEITEETTNLVDTIVILLGKNTETQKVFSELKHLSDGGIMAHSNRVFVSYINFLVFYNHLVNRMHLVHKVRSNFIYKYKKYYDKIFKTINKENINKNLKSVEDCVDKGMRGLEHAHLSMYAMGALLHDIGKVKDLNYFEGATGRDIERIQKHLFNSYALVTQTAEYPLEVILTVAFHHEYYGQGYGPFNNFYEQKILRHPQFKMSTVLTYDAKVIDNCDAFGYFPAKMLEIVDVYDALIDPARKYRGGKIFTAEESLKIMRDDFIVNHLKLDPILFDIFVDFIGQTLNKDFSYCSLGSDNTA